jgi:hypothetical protein
MRHLLTLSGSRDEPLERRVRAIAARHRLTNLFNLSALRGPDLAWHVAFRAEATAGARPFRAYYTRLAEPDRSENLVDLTALMAGHGVPRVADPKLLTLAGDVFVTFNTGFVRGGQNRLCLQRLTPEPGRPWTCVLDGRRPVEKNWAFYPHPGGGLGAVYEATPRLTTLVADRWPDQSDTAVRFVRDGDHPTGIDRPLSIGAQLQAAGPGVGQFVLHQKWQLLGKRFYCGRMARFEFWDRPRLSVSSVRLLHSVRRAIPPLHRHNPNLLSATYFAGVVTDRDRVVLTYGINDLDFGIARVREDALWP